MIDIEKVLQQDDADKFFDYIKNQKRRYYSLDLGKYIRLEMLLYQFSFQAGYSYEKSEEQSHIINFTLGIFAINFMW